jgi:hypothetical protein
MAWHPLSAILTAFFHVSRQGEMFQAVEYIGVFLFYTQGELHARIHWLLSLRHGVSPGAKDGGGDVAITSPYFLRCFFAVIVSAFRLSRLFCPTLHPI